jgi:acyl-CoA reductase-like NAD-dependent aldehyde dehydrogenase
MAAGVRYDAGWVDAEPYPQLIDGQELRSGPLHDVIDPSTGEAVAMWSEATAEEVDAALAAARRSFDGGEWSRAPLARRAEILDAAAAAIRQHGERLVTLESLDTGKSVSGARHFDLYEASAAFSYAAGICRDLHGDVRTTSYPPELFPAGGPEIITMRMREPAGVVVELLPWNAPLMTGSQRVAAGLAAGCSFVVKPAEEAVITTVNLARLLESAGLPRGVLNVVLGPGETVGEQLVADRRVDLVSLTGSVATGQRVMALAARNLTPVHLELGGKAPVIVFADADLDQAVHWATMAAFVNNGQVCVAGSRLLAERPVYGDVVEGIAKAAAGLPMGDALDPGTFLGPLVTEGHADRVRGFLDRATAGGEARVVGSPPIPPAHPRTFVAPTVLRDVRPGAEIEQEEVFGPLLASVPFETEGQALAIANDTRFGLNATIFTGDIERAFRAFSGLRCGEVNVNCHFTPDMNGAKGEPRKMSGVSAADVESYTVRKAMNLQVRRPRS